MQSTMETEIRHSQRLEMVEGGFERAYILITLKHLFYTPYEGLNLANQIIRKLGVFDRKLEGNHSTFHCYSDIY